ncbi:lipoate--protein ligase family protein [Candidatus Peregrinibacteria bacterium]|nr:lipoate--protein ligase family protein [Candidatus Peregrinibacteria bacterium]
MSNWRVIALETHDANMNMAVDEAISEAVASREVPPTIRFYKWSPGAVSIGYFQSLRDEVSLSACLKQGVDYVRRRTGGGAVYHDPTGEITYSVIAPENIFPKGIIDSYRLICGWIIESLRLIDIEAEFKPINDIVLSADGRKISGNAQTRRKGVLLQHGTVLYDVDVKKMFSLLKVGESKIADKMIAAVEDRVSCVRALKPELEMADLYKALVQGFLTGKKWEEGDLTLAEMQRAHELAVERYGDKMWNEMR